MNRTGPGLREPDWTQVQEARLALRNTVVHTPLLRVEAPGGGVWHLKLENLQRTGSFKIRGAFNRIRKLPAARRERGVIAMSAGNHAQGVALAAARMGVPATIVIPRGAPIVKVEATRRLGADIHLVDGDFGQAYREALNLQRSRDLTLIHPYDDPDIIAGQGTIALEILEELPEVAVVLVPLGGGGLLSGIAMTIKAIRPQTRVIGVQAAAADAFLRSRAAGEPVEIPKAKTLADGLAVKRPGDLTFALVNRYVDDVVAVEEDEIAVGILWLLEHTKLVVEGAGAVGLAAALHGKVKLPDEKSVILISGGNIDIHFMARIIERGLVRDGRHLRFQTVVEDRPGALHRLLGLVAAEGANVVTIDHDRLKPHVPLGETEVRLVVEVRDHEEGRKLLRTLEERGYACRREDGPETPEPENKSP